MSEEFTKELNINTSFHSPSSILRPNLINRRKRLSEASSSCDNAHEANREVTPTKMHATLVVDMKDKPFSTCT